MSERRGLVLDPDTFELPDRTRTRVQGADAWESGHPAAARGTAVAERDLDWSTIKPGGKDHYGRTLVSARTKDGKDYATYLIEGGYAVPMSGSTQEQHNAEATFAYRAGPGGERFESPEVRENRELLREEWATAPMPNYAHAVPGGPQQRGGTFAQSYQRGVQQNKANVGALTHMMGKWAGWETVADWGQDVMEAGEAAAARYAPEVGTYTNIEDVNDAWTYAVEALGENVFTLLAMAMTAGVGALGARAAAGTMSKKLIEKYGVEGARAKVAAISKGGALAGTGASSYTMVTGELANEFEEHGLFNPGLVLGAGVPMAALDTFAVAYIMKPMFSALEKVAAQGVKTDHLTKVVAKSLGAHVTRGFAAEAPTESMQEAIQLAARTIEDPNFHMWSPEEQESTLVQLIDAFLKGGIVGGAMGGAPGAVQGVRTYNQLQREDQDPNEARTRPEAPGDLVAQLRAHSAGNRGPVWVEGTQSAPKDTGLAEVEIPGKGVFLVMPDQAETVQQQVVEAVNEGLDAEDIVARVVGYGKSKSQLDPASTVAVHGLDERGNIVWTELADNSTLEEAKGRAQKAGGEKGGVQVQDVQDALKQREERRAAPAELRTQFGEELKDASPKAKAAARKRVKDMTPEEMQQALLTNFATGLPNMRAFEEDADQKGLVALASIDMDSLKWFNDAINHEAGDAALMKLGEVFKAVLATQPKDSVRIYHKSGDEFLVRAKTQARANAFLKEVDRRLAQVELKFDTKDGPITKKGLGISYGVTAKDMAAAEERLQQHKQQRMEKGLRPNPKERGAEPPGVIRGKKPVVANETPVGEKQGKSPRADERQADKEPDTQKHAKGFPQPKKAAETTAETTAETAATPDTEQDIRLRIAQMKSKTSIGSMLDWIIAVGTPRQQALAAAVKKAVPEILEVRANKGKVSAGALATSWTGRKRDGSDAGIGFDYGMVLAHAKKYESAAIVTETALHEILHVALFAKVNWNTLTEASLADPDAFLDLQTVFNSFKAHVKGLKQEDLTATERWVLGEKTSMRNIDEFVVMAMSNPTVQEHLAQIKIGDKGTAWDAFVDWFMQIVGLTKEHRTALDETLQLGAGLLGLQPSMEVAGKPLDQVKMTVEAEVDGATVSVSGLKASEALKLADDRIDTLKKMRRCVG